MRVKLLVLGTGDHTEFSSVGDPDGLRAVGEAFIAAATPGGGMQAVEVADAMTGEPITWRVIPGLPQDADTSPRSPSERR